MMPPKSVSKKQKVSTDLIIEGTNISRMGPDELVVYIVKLMKELHDTKKKRSFEEQERDVFFRQLEIARSELLTNKAYFLTKKRDVENAQEQHHLELKVSRQRANHLKYELHKEVQNEHELQEQQALISARQRFCDREDILEEAEKIQREGVDERRAFEQSMKELVFKLNTEGEDVRQNYAEALADRREYFRIEREEALEEAQVDLETYSRKADQERLENTTHLQLNFEKNFHDIKRYFQELTYHNLSMIEELKTQSTAMKHHIAQLVAQLHQIQEQNHRSREPFLARQQKLADLRKQVELFRKDEAAFCRVTKELVSLRSEREALKEEISATQTEFQEIQTTIKEIHTNYTPASHEAKHLIGTESNLIHHKTTQLKTELDRLKNEMHVRIANGSIDAQDFLNQIENPEQQCLNNIALRKEYELSIDKMTKVYNDSLQSIRYLIKEYALPLDTTQIDLTPINHNTTLSVKPAEVTRLKKTFQKTPTPETTKNH